MTGRNRVSVTPTNIDPDTDTDTDTDTDADIDAVGAALALHWDNPRLRLFGARLRLAAGAASPDEMLLRGALNEATAVLSTTPGDLDALSVAEQASWGLGEVEAAVGCRARIDEEERRRLAEGVVHLMFPAGPRAAPALSPLPAALRRRPGSTARRWHRHRLLVFALTAAVMVMAAEAAHVLVPGLL